LDRGAPAPPPATAPAFAALRAGLLEFKVELGPEMVR